MYNNTSDEPVAIQLNSAKFSYAETKLFTYLISSDKTPNQ